MCIIHLLVCVHYIVCVHVYCAMYVYCVSIVKHQVQWNPSILDTLGTTQLKVS